MADYPVYTITDIQTVSGRDDVGAYADEALRQAVLLFKTATCLYAFPDDTYGADMARYAILFMAEAIESVQPYQKILRTPFSSETIGSYSYSKLSSAVSAGLPTGVSWFDIATAKLSVCDALNGVGSSGGWNVFEENKTPHGGYGIFLGPADQFPDGYGPDTVRPPEAL